MEQDGQKRQLAWLETRNDDMRWLNPRCKEAFIRLSAQLRRDYQEGIVKVLFAPFEVYRTPMRQQKLFELQKNVTGAQAYQSAHQFGLAVDFVPKLDGTKWSWDGSMPWDHLAKRAKEHGLSRPYSWDLAHIEDPYWQDLRHVMRSL